MKQCGGYAGTNLVGTFLLLVLSTVGAGASQSRYLRFRPGRDQLRNGGKIASVDVRDEVCDGVKVRKKDGQTYGLHRRASPVRVVDLVQLGNVHELPLLRLRLAEMAELVDEIHIVEADRDFSMTKKESVLPELLASDAEIARWRQKIIHHVVRVPENLSGYKFQAYTIEEAKRRIPGSGVLFQGDLDEIISRSVLKSARHCEPYGGWNAGIQMELFMYNMGWTTGRWGVPSIVSEYDAASASLLITNHHVSSDSKNLTEYLPFPQEGTVFCLSGQAGWHIAWTLDGADGLAHKILRGRIEGVPAWAQPHATSEEALATWIRQEFLPNPQLYDKTIYRTHLSASDLPEAMLKDPSKYKALLGDALSVATAGQGPLTAKLFQAHPASAHSPSMPCACEPTSTTWKRTARKQPQCVFIDLGAADGNSFASFLAGSFGKVSDCPSGGSYEAYLVEANPRFQPALHALQTAETGKVHALSPEAAYMCRGQTNFYLDTTGGTQNYWGSSMSTEHPDVKKSGHQRVTVPTSNVVQLVAEHTIPEDWVVVKMDIEGAEWDILPCLAKSPEASLIDELLVEMHPSRLGLSGTTETEMQAAVVKLKSRGIKMPEYFSGTL